MKYYILLDENNCERDGQELVMGLNKWHGSVKQLSLIEFFNLTPEGVLGIRI
jgi:hypothetical protein